MVTVVDAYNFFKDFGSPEKLDDRGLTDMEGDDRTIVNLLTDQIEFANVILINKVDLVDEVTVNILRSAIQKLNPGAKVIETTHSKVGLNEVVNTRSFNYEDAENSAGWIEELNKEEHTPETEEYGISSFVFRSKKPFHPDRFWYFVAEKFPTTIIRSKGLFWILSKPDQATSWSQAGGSLKADSIGLWWDSMSYQNRIQYAPFVENQAVIVEEKKYFLFNLFH